MKLQEKSKNSGMVFFIDNVKIVISVVGNESDQVTKEQSVSGDDFIQKRTCAFFSQSGILDKEI